MKNKKELRPVYDGKDIRVLTQNSFVYNFSGLEAFYLLASQFKD